MHNPLHQMLNYVPIALTTKLFKYFDRQLCHIVRVSNLGLPIFPLNKVTV